MTQVYNVEGNWCFLNVYLKKNNTCLIDWEECEITDNFINTEIMDNKNILCIKNDEYCFYNTNKKLYYLFTGKKIILPVDGIKNLMELSILNNRYENKLVFIK